MTTSDGMAAVKAGDLVSARRLLIEATRANAADATAWLWLSAAVSDPAERRYCLNQVLALHPGSPAATKGMATLGPGEARSPVTFAPVEAVPVEVPAEPPLPPFVAPPIVPHLPGVPDRQLIEQEIGRRTQDGWHVVSQTDTSVQLVKKKVWSTAGLVFFVVLPALGGFLLYAPLYGLAVIGLLLVLLDYLFKKEPVDFLTAQDLRRRALGEATQAERVATAAATAVSAQRKPPSTMRSLVITGGVLALIAGTALVANLLFLPVKRPSVPTSEPALNVNDIDAGAACRRVVRQRFTVVTFGESQKVISKGDKRYDILVGGIHKDNRGVEVASMYACLMRYDAGQWTLETFDFTPL